MKTAPSIAFVTDSTADIPTEQQNLFRIEIVPNILIVEGKCLEDGKDISREEFYRRLPTLKLPPTTSTASSGAYEQVYERVLSQGARQVISVHAASALSGIYNSARVAASRFNERVYVIDSKQLSLGTGFQVLAAAEAAARGATIEKVLETLQKVRLRIRVVAMLDTLEYVRRSGRVSWARARLGSLLNIKPFVEVKEGQVMSIGETRTRRKGIERLKELLLKQGPLERLAILHTNSELDARQILDDINPYLLLTEISPIINVTTIVGVHTGPNGLGFAVVHKG